MDALTDLLSSRVKAEVFRLLFGSTPQELHVREIARQSQLADGTVRQELKKLSRIGLVESRLAGNRTYYHANIQHPLYSEIHSIVLKTNGLVDVLREPLTHPMIRIAFVFGSIAGGKEKAHSDVDLMIIGTIGLRRLSKLLSGIADRLGREVNPHVLTPEELLERRKAREHFLTAVMKAPKLFVIGDENELEGLGR